jgi:hypothetical protein
MRGIRLILMKSGEKGKNNFKFILIHIITSHKYMYLKRTDLSNLNNNNNNKSLRLIANMKCNCV